MSETILQEIYNEIKKIREKLEQLEELKGEHVDWEHLRGV